MGKALKIVAEQLDSKIMPQRALPPGSSPTVCPPCQSRYTDLMAQPCKKAVRLAIAIGGDAEKNVLQRFIGQTGARPTMPKAMQIHQMGIDGKAASPAASQTLHGDRSANVALPPPPDEEDIEEGDVW